MESYGSYNGYYDHWDHRYDRSNSIEGNFHLVLFKSLQYDFLLDFLRKIERKINTLILLFFYYYIFYINIYSTHLAILCRQYPWPFVIFYFSSIKTTHPSSLYLSYPTSTLLYFIRQFSPFFFPITGSQGFSYLSTPQDENIKRQTPLPFISFLTLYFFTTWRTPMVAIWHPLALIMHLGSLLHFAWLYPCLLHSVRGER